MTLSSYRILGVDPGLNITGYAVVEFASPSAPPVVLEAGAIRTHAEGEIAERIAQIYADLSDILAEQKPHRVAVEQLYAHYEHPRTGILMAHARGVVLLAARQAGCGVDHLPATRVKKSLTGNGHASKAQMQRAVQTLCRLDAAPEPADVADALAIALCAGRNLGR